MPVHARTRTLAHCSLFVCLCWTASPVKCVPMIAHSQAAGSQEEENLKKISISISGWSQASNHMFLVHATCFLVVLTCFLFYSKPIFFSILHPDNVGSQLMTQNTVNIHPCLHRHQEVKFSLMKIASIIGVVLSIVLLTKGKFHCIFERQASFSTYIDQARRLAGTVY